MARLPQICSAGVPQHITQRGNNRQVCFGGDEDFAAYAHWLRYGPGQRSVHAGRGAPYTATRSSLKAWTEG